MDYRGVSKRKFRFSKLKKYNKEAFCNIIYENEQLVVESPVVQASTKVVRNKNKTFIILELDEESRDFYDFLKMVDHMCINMTAKNSEKWFQGKKVSKDAIKSAYQSPCIEENPMLVRFLLGSVNRIYNHRGERIPSTNVEVGSKLKFVLQLSGLWVTGNFIGVHWQIEEMELLAKKKSPERKNKLKTSRRESDEDEEYMMFRKKFAEKYHQNDENSDDEYDENSDDEDDRDHKKEYSSKSRKYVDDPEGYYESEDEDLEDEDDEELYKHYKKKLDEARKYISKYKETDDDDESIERRRSFETDSEEAELEILSKPPKRSKKRKGKKQEEEYESYSEELEMDMDFSKLNYGKKRNIKETIQPEPSVEEELETNETNDEIKKVNF